MMIPETNINGRIRSMTGNFRVGTYWLRIVSAVAPTAAVFQDYYALANFRTTIGELHVISTLG